jgi:hypothetical protein
MSVRWLYEYQNDISELNVDLINIVNKLQYHMMEGHIKSGNFYHDVVYTMINDTQYLSKYEIGTCDVFDNDHSYYNMSNMMYRSVIDCEDESELVSLFDQFIIIYMQIVKKRHCVAVFINRCIRWDSEAIDMWILSCLCYKYMKDHQPK